MRNVDVFFSEQVVAETARVVELSGFKAESPADVALPTVPLHGEEKHSDPEVKPEEAHYANGLYINIKQVVYFF